MSDKDDSAQSSSGMADHLQRYKSYIDNLKKGKSSGISAAFGRATDLLPPELFEIKPPQVKNESRLPEPQVALTNEEQELISNLEGILNEGVVDTEEGVDTEEDVDTEGDVDTEEDVDTEKAVDTEEDAGTAEDATAADETFDHESTKYDSDVRAGETNLEFDDNSWDEGWPELSVSTASGDSLWKIYYDGPDVRSVVMSDGSSIRRAEGRPEFVLALKSDKGSSFRFFVLDGLIVDPSTGNLYVEANEGAYSAAFLNNGWILHQYRTHDGSETYYATAPATGTTGDAEGRSTSQVLNLTLDVAIGEVTYEALDGTASTTLKSRTL